MRKRVGFVAEEGLADALLYAGVEGIDISDRAVGIDQPVLHRPKTCPCDFTLPALKSRRASRMLRRYSGEAAARRSSRNTCLADFFMLLTARIIVSGLTSILTAVGIAHLLSFGSP